MSGLTDFQVQVARIFFALPESAGFLVAGGAALIAQELVARETRDLDLFASPRPSVTTAVEAFESALTGHGWTVTRTQDGAQFVRLLVHGTEDLIVDIGVDSAPERTPVMCVLGPSYDPLELAGRKLLALFDRAEARDFTDVHALANLYGTNTILDVASHLDAGLTPDLLATSISTAHRFRPTEFPIPAEDVPDMLAFFTAWREQLLGSSPAEDDASQQGPDEQDTTTPRR